MGAYMGCIPNLTIMAPSDEIELKNMMKTCADFDSGPTVLRYPRGNGYGAEKLQELFGYELENDEIPAKGEPLPIGKGRIIRTAGGFAANEVEAKDPNLGVTVADARFMKPLDVDLVRQL